MLIQYFYVLEFFYFSVEFDAMIFLNPVAGLIIIAVSATEQLGQPINDVIIFLAFYYSSDWLDDAVTNQKSEKLRHH